MAEISQIRLPNNTVLDLKDATARPVDIPLTLTFNENTNEYTLTYTGTSIEDAESPQARLLVTCPDGTIKIFYKVEAEYNSFSSLNINDTHALSTIDYIDGNFYFQFINFENYIENINAPDLSSYISMENDGFASLDYKNKLTNKTAQIQYGAFGGNDYTKTWIGLSSEIISLLGQVDLDNNNIINLATPTADTMAANKKYVDDNTPSPESMSNVQAMLTELGLDPNASLTPATVPAETNHALVQEG